MKNQVDILNITGAVVSASLIVFLYFSPLLKAFSLTKNWSISKTQKVRIQQKLSLKRNKKLPPSTFADTSISPIINQEKTIPKQVTSIERQKPEYQPTQVAEKCEESTKSNGCPKKLEYFTTRPRPKQTPEECITCKNLIACVCLTDN